MRFHRMVWFVVLIALLVPIYSVRAQEQPAQPVVISPRAGEAVIGLTEISGVTGLPGFQRVEVEYRYTNDPKNTWFLIAEADKSVNPGKIADWDTSLISDGTYDLRVTVYKADGSSQSTTVRGIRVRNYSPVETSTPPDPGKIIASLTLEATAVPTRTPRPTPMPLPPNPAVLTRSQLNASLLRGAGIGLGFFFLFGIYWITKRSLR
ncbi:MAG: hypothetical protein GYA12_10595 [Chloroflexi bacterium]|nr:hypothetical protein [Chloroflexota bacterium]